ncbi:MAG: radical SAM protein [Nitrospinota bacterium]|nr:radical SAM protein [Nitrospinota bacterium]
MINPYLTGATYNDSSAPLGILSLISYAREQIPNCKMDFLDLVALSKGNFCETPRGIRLGPTNAEIRKLAANMNPDVIGITCMFTSFADDGYEVVDLFRDIFPNAFIVMGGAHVSYDIDDALQKTSADAVVINEGEISFVELLKAVDTGSNLEEVKGIAFKANGGEEIIHTPEQPNYPRLDDFPQPAYELYDFEYYSKSIIRGQLLKGNRIGFLFTSRGCPYDCVFCSTKVMWTRKWRAQSAERVFEDIKYLVEEFGVDEFIFNDDALITNIKRMEQICDLIIEAGFKINLHIQAGVTVWLLTENLLKKMVQAGLYRLRLPVETGCETTLKYVNKPVDLKKTKEMIPLLHKLGLWISGNFIIGFPEETREEILESIRYAEDSTMDDVLYLIAQPYAGADMYTDYENLGLLENRLDQSSYTRTLYDTTTLKAHEIQELKFKADEQFSKLRFKRLLSPKFLTTILWPKINSLVKFKYALRLGRVVFSVAFQNLFYSNQQILNGQSGRFDKSRKITKTAEVETLSGVS